MVKLKSLSLGSGVIQSPMAGCTDLAFRLVARRHGMEFAFLEMVSAESLVRANAKTHGLLKSVAEDKPLGAQLVGCNPDIMGAAAVILEDLGFDLIDINMGCPVPKIVSPGGGSALLIEPQKAREIFVSIVKNVRRAPVTVKMRKGFEDPSGDEAVRIAQIAEDSGLSAVTVHGRTRAQGYSGQADWQAIRKVKQAVRIPVFGNGDVMSGDDAKRLIQETGCDGVMIGRGGLGNPWVYKDIDDTLSGKETRKPVPTLEEKRHVLLEHLRLEIQTEGEHTGCLKMRKIACWYFKNYPGNAAFRDAVNHAVTEEEFRRLIGNFNATA